MSNSNDGAVTATADAPPGPPSTAASSSFRTPMARRATFIREADVAGAIVDYASPSSGSPTARDPPPRFGNDENGDDDNNGSAPSPPRRRKQPSVTSSPTEGPSDTTDDLISAHQQMQQRQGAPRRQTVTAATSRPTTLSSSSELEHPFRSSADVFDEAPPRPPASTAIVERHPSTNAVDDDQSASTAALLANASFLANGSGGGAAWQRSGPGGGGNCANRVLSKLHGFFEKLPVQIVMVLITLLDVGFLIYEFAANSTQFEVVTLFTSLSFFLEMLIHIGYMGWRRFLRFDKWWMIAEVLIVSTSFAVEFLEFSLKAFVHVDSGEIRLFRAVRFFRVLILWKTRSRKVAVALRRFVSADRRRFQEDGYDLDLTYINKHLIAMSWPSENVEALYRNHIDVVAKFLDEHHPNQYMVYNLCSERGYDESKFHDHVRRYRLDDHNPGELALMLTFAQEVTAFAREKAGNVPVIHCKGGKGRTGTMTCAFLLYSRQAADADAALGMFGQTRTADLAKSFQGVESPSQDRYVHYFDKLLRVPGHGIPPRRVRLTKLRISFLPPQFWNVGRLWFAVILKPNSDRIVHYKSNPMITFTHQVREKGTTGGAAAASPTPKTPSGKSVPTDATSTDDAAAARTSPLPPPPSASRRGRSVFDSSPPKEDPACLEYRGNMVVFVTDNLIPMSSDAFLAKYVASDSGGGDNSSGGAVDGTNGSGTAATSFGGVTPGSAPGIGGGGGGGEGAVPNSSSIFVSNQDQRTLTSMKPLDAMRVDIEVSTSGIAPFDGDTIIKFFYDTDNPSTLHCPIQVWLHPSFEGSEMALSKLQVDGPHKDVKHKKYAPGFKIDIGLEDAR